MNADRDLAGAIQGLIAERLTVEVKSRDADLLADGVLDSVSIVQLIFHLERSFGVRIELAELEIDDLRSVRSIANLITRLQEDSRRKDLVLTHTGNVL